MRTTAITYLVALALVDVVLPIPIVALLGLYVVFRKPRWFSELVREIYEDV